MVRTPVPTPQAVPSSPPWVKIVGAAFGAITLLFLMVCVLIAGQNPQFVCNSFTILALIFAFGCGLSAAFLGGAAALDGRLGLSGRQNAFAFSVGGGVSVVFIAFILFNHFPPTRCQGVHVEEDQTWKKNYALFGNYGWPKLPELPDSVSVKWRPDLICRLDQLVLDEDTLTDKRNAFRKSVDDAHPVDQANPNSIRIDDKINIAYQNLKSLLRANAVKHGIDVERIEREKPIDC